MSNERGNQGEWRMGKRRTNRKTLFAQNGFMPFEQEAFSKLPLNIPYAKMMRRDRLKLFARAKKEKWPLNKYRQAVAWEYESRNILSNKKDYKGKAFALLKWFESEWLKTVDPNDPYFKNRATRKHHGHRELIDKEKVRKQKQEYRQRNADKIREYRRTHRPQIKEAERKRRDFKKRQMLNG